MGNVVKLKDVHSMHDLPAVLNDDPWATASEGQRRVAQMREALVLPLANLVKAGASINHVAKMLVTQVDAGCVDQRTRQLLAQVGREAASVATLKRWISAYIKQGQMGLLPRHTGRVRKAYGWEERAVELYNIPGKPGFADVFHRLRQEGFEDITESRVARYLKSLSATQGKFSPARVGHHLHKLTRRNYVRRSVDELLVGEVLSGDGHTVDVYVAHPNTGKPLRLELTVWIDIKSRFVPGWWPSESESGNSTLFALSQAMRQFDHVPAWVYIDRGAGYKAQMLSDESTGFYSRFDIQTIGALPGNPHGKGWIERFFVTVRNRCDKFFAGGNVYCGDDMAPEINRRLSADLASGKRKLPSLQEYMTHFQAFLDQYHHTPMDSLGGRTPAEVWAELQPVPVSKDMDAVVRPVEARTVRRQAITLHKRTYYAEALIHYDTALVHVEYDLHDDRKVWVRTTKGKLIAEATLVETIGVLPTSRLEEQRDIRLAGQLRRLERHVEEAKQRRNDPITADEQLGAIGLYQDEQLPEPQAEAMTPLALSAPEPDQPDTPTATDADWDLDITSWKDDQK
jgi:putative transposase